MSKLTLDDCVYNCLLERDVNGSVRYWSFWDLQARIHRKVGTFYGEPSISAALRNLRKKEARAKYGLPKFGEIVLKRRIQGSKGYEYRITESALNYMENSYARQKDPF